MGGGANVYLGLVGQRWQDIKINGSSTLVPCPPLSCQYIVMKWIT